MMPFHVRSSFHYSVRYDDADGSTVTKTYDSFGNPATETNARGQVTRYTYDSFRNLMLVITFSDGTIC